MIVIGGFSIAVSFSPWVKFRKYEGWFHCYRGVDCKIVTKMITVGLTEILDLIIGPQRTGYVPGHFIGVSVHKIIEIMLCLKCQEVPAFYANWRYLQMLWSTIWYFTIGEHIISRVELLYKNFEVCTINAGRISDWWQPGWGIHQRCRLSSPTFVCIAEILAHRIWQNSKAKGINIEFDLIFSIKTQVWKLAIRNLWHKTGKYKRDKC